LIWGVKLSIIDSTKSIKKDMGSHDTAQFGALHNSDQKNKKVKSEKRFLF
jgi:hypothetical protein